MCGPYGPRRVTYADYTASRRALDFIERFVADEVLPRYANTHTESSGTGLQTTRLREDARRIVRDAVGGDDTTIVIFTGSGSTGAIDKLIHILGLRIPAGLDDRYDLSARIPREQRPVVFIGPTEHHYIEDPAHREEGGTPAIVESIRAGLVFQLKQAVGVDVIRAREEYFLRRAIGSWRTNPNIEILGNLDAERLSIVSFVVRRPGGRYLHHNFVVALLNDVFGIQSRGGCSCAGPYGHRLLGMDTERSHP